MYYQQNNVLKKLNFQFLLNEIENLNLTFLTPCTTTFWTQGRTELKQDIFINILVFIIKLKSTFCYTLIKNYLIKQYTNIYKKPYVNKLNYNIYT